ncbi:MAG: hypothetical protein ACXV6M_14320 [Ilumatobacteraceae bacterium]
MSDVHLTPDGVRYIAATKQRVARPFHYRWLIPKLCGDSESRWRWMNQISTIGLLPLIYWFIGGWRGIAAGAMVTGLAGVWKFNRKHIILVDAPGMFCALLAADLFRHHLWPLGIAVALVGGCVRETSPVMAALYAWNPLALIGLAPAAVRHLQREGPDVLDAENRWILDHVFRASIKYHRRLPNIVPLLILPWGGALVALSNYSPQLALTAAVAYGQLLIATDTVRLYQWCFPVVLLAAVHAVPMAWLPLLVVLTIANPFASEGG